MSRLDLGDSSFPIRIFGQDIDLEKPGMQQVLSHEMKVKQAESDPEKIYDLMRQFVISLGMPEEIANKMTLDQYLRLTESLNPQKKN